MRVTGWNIRQVNCPSGRFTVVFDRVLRTGSRIPGHHDFFAAIAKVEAARRGMGRAS